MDFYCLKARVQLNMSLTLWDITAQIAKESSWFYFMYDVFIDQINRSRCLIFQILPKVLFIERPKKEDSIDEDEEDKPPDHGVSSVFDVSPHMDKYLG